MAARDGLLDGAWIDTQKKIFQRWNNAYLKIRFEKVDDLYTDLQNGVLLIHLLEILGNMELKHRPKEKATMAIYQQENLKVAFDYMKSQNVELINCSGKDIHEGNDKIILGG